jgi:hypothetical protein
MSPTEGTFDALSLTHRGENLTGRIELGGRFFERCAFKDAILVYSGGPTRLDGCSFTNVSFLVAGSALEAMRFLATMQQIGFGSMVDMMFHRIKTNQLRDEPY